MTPRTATTFGPPRAEPNDAAPEPPEPDGDGWEPIGGGIVSYVGYVFNDDNGWVNRTWFVCWTKWVRPNPVDPV